VKFVAAGHRSHIATFGIAGPVRNAAWKRQLHGWSVKRLAAELKTENVWVINDGSERMGHPLLSEKGCDL
jgi:glucokinase